MMTQWRSLAFCAALALLPSAQCLGAVAVRIPPDRSIRAVVLDGVILGNAQPDDDPARQPTVVGISNIKLNVQADDTLEVEITFYAAAHHQLLVQVYLASDDKAIECFWSGLTGTHGRLMTKSVRFDPRTYFAAPGKRLHVCWGAARDFDQVKKEYDGGSAALRKFNMRAPIASISVE
jgi:hypothetical protein